jgi:hypothetical protein
MSPLECIVGVWGQCQQPPGVANRLIQRIRLHVCVDQCGQRPYQVSAQTLRLGAQPFLELGAIGEAQAAGEIILVEGDSALQVVNHLRCSRCDKPGPTPGLLYVRAELDHIHRHVWPHRQTDPVALDLGRSAAQQAMQGEDGAAQVAARRLLRLLRPEECGQLVATVHPLAGDQVDEQGKRLAAADVDRVSAAMNCRRAQ